MTASPAPFQQNLSAAWQAVLGRLEVELSSHQFNTFLRGSRAISFDGSTLRIEARTSVDHAWLTHKLGEPVERAVEQQLGCSARVEFLAAGAATPQPAPVAAAPTPAGLLGRLNAGYTFERYLPGESNLLAFESCNALIDDDALAISPVVIFGSPGLGKTHLIHALASRAVSLGKNVACLHAEEFTTRYMTAIRNGEMEQFQSSLRAVDLLVIDDLQYLSGKKGTLDELVHTIDAVTHAGGHVVIASERHPLDLQLPDRLSSRLSAGLVTRIHQLQREERRSYIEHLARHLRAGLPGWAIDRIAGIEVPSTRTLQGAVHAAVALSRANRLDLGRLDAELHRLTLAELAPAGMDDATLLGLIAAHFDTTFDALAGRSRVAAVANARAVAVYTLKERGRSLTQIGELLGKRDRSTISQLQARGRELLEADPTLKIRIAS